MDHSTGSRNRTTIGVERHRWPQSYVQKLLGPVEIARCEKRRSRAQLGIHQWTISNSLNSYSSEQIEGRASLTTRWTVRRPLGYQQNTAWNPAEVLLASDIEKWCRVWYLCSQSRPTAQESEPNEPVKLWSAVLKGSNWCSRTVFTEQPRKPIPPDRYGLFTKCPEAYAIPNKEASTIAEALVTNSYCRFGNPRELHSDEGRNFKSHLLQEILQPLGLSKTRTTPLRRQSDGLV
jgi:hypothetical protein